MRSVLALALVGTSLVARPALAGWLDPANSYELRVKKRSPLQERRFQRRQAAAAGASPTPVAGAPGTQLVTGQGIVCNTPTGFSFYGAYLGYDPAQFYLECYYGTNGNPSPGNAANAYCFYDSTGKAMLDPKFANPQFTSVDFCNMYPPTSQAVGASPLTYTRCPTTDVAGDQLQAAGGQGGATSQFTLAQPISQKGYTFSQCYYQPAGSTSLATLVQCRYDPMTGANNFASLGGGPDLANRAAVCLQQVQQSPPAEYLANPYADDY